MEGSLRLYKAADWSSTKKTSWLSKKNKNIRNGGERGN